jgi:hypothetical protein
MGYVTRTNVKRGPAQLIYNSATIYSKGGVSIDQEASYFSPETDRFGALAGRVEDVAHRISLVPDGQWLAANLTAMFPYALTDIGDSVMDGTDAVVHWKAGQKRTYANAYVSRMPTIKLSAKETLFNGALELTCRRAGGAGLEATGAIFTDADATYPGDAAFDPANIKTQCQTVSWSQVSADIPTEDGVEIEIIPEFEEFAEDCGGVYDVILTGLTARATFTPLGWDPSDLAENGAGYEIPRGGLSDLVSDLVVSSSGIYVALYNAEVVRVGEAAGNGTKRHGPITLEARRTFTSGVSDPLFFIGTAEPS